MKPTLHIPHQDQPWKHSFTNLLRSISAKHPHLPAAGRAQKPSQEAFALGQTATLGFASREIESLWQSQDGQGKTHIQLYGMGTLGANGPLPLHITELVRERVASKRDHTLAHFLDLFHHRAFSHQYRAWSQAQAAAGLDRAGEESFTNYIARLAGDEPSEVQTSALPPHARWASSAHRIRQSRNPDGLVGTLKRYFGVPVRIEEYAMHWIPLQEVDTCRLGFARQSTHLGAGAIAGDTVPDRQTRFLIQIGPLTIENYLKLTPSSLEGNEEGQPAKPSDLASLVEWVRAFVGFEYEWEVELFIDARAARAVALGGEESPTAARLGWSTWMGDTQAGQAMKSQATATPLKPVSGMRIIPERYFKKKASL
jgi:type VI secretion system protein ImpH